MQNKSFFVAGHFVSTIVRTVTKIWRQRTIGQCCLVALLKPDGTDGVKLCDGVTYVGPFYFETESMKAEDIIRCEREMIESCTDAVFVLDDAACPGTIAEMMYANSLGKTLHLFYVQHKNDEETESELHSPCWYPIQLCQLINNSVNLYPCCSVEDATNRIQSFVKSLKS